MIAGYLTSATARTINDGLMTDMQSSSTGQDGIFSVWDVHMRMSRSNMQPSVGDRGISKQRTPIRVKVLGDKVIAFFKVFGHRKGSLHAIFISSRNGQVR